MTVFMVPDRRLQRGSSRPASSTELIHRRGPWRTVEQLEFAVFEYLDWWNHRRLHGEIGLVPPAELEAHYYSQQHPVPEGSTL